ncbi:MAG: DUF2076 family protein [Dechloromonas sp.]|uniref:DUF2076 family protein n=1 Tax=Candidatus Dechloromonas phosphorivorans TaxID=2899244 RepID=A0A935JVC7_9RHOO|nr:DUF2076 family protein [Candidatus Dechloromonas phosphorivorans]
MNIQEREQLTQFLQQLKGAQVGAKDAEAERLIQETCRQQADASYLLVQRSMLLGQALRQRRLKLPGCNKRWIRHALAATVFSEATPGATRPLHLQLAYKGLLDWRLSHQFPRLP